MKKVIFTALAITAVLALFSCGSKTPSETTADSKVTSGTSAFDSTSFTDTQKTEPSGDTQKLPYTVSKSICTDDNGLSYLYDTVYMGEGLDDKAFYKLNSELKGFYDTVFASYIPNASSVGKDGRSAKYNVSLRDSYCDGKLLSVTFAGEYEIYSSSTADAEQGEVFYSLNINIEEKRMIPASEIVASFDGLKKAALDGKFSGGMLSSEMFSSFYPDYDIYPYVYFDKDNFYFNINSTGVSETNAQYSISRTEGADFLGKAYIK